MKIVPYYNTVKSPAQLSERSLLDFGVYNPMQLVAPSAVSII